MASPIPEAWRRAVGKILRSGDRSKIIVRQRARNDWETTFPEDFLTLTMYNAMAEALEDDNVEGKRHEMDEPGETWAFRFSHRRRDLYGKIGLTPEGNLVIIYSAHRPLKGDKL